MRSTTLAAGLGPIAAIAVAVSLSACVPTLPGRGGTPTAAGNATEVAQATAAAVYGATSSPVTAAAPRSRDTSGADVPAAATPYVRVSLHPGDITGRVAVTSTDLALALVGPDDSERGAGRARSDEEGRFSGWVHAPDGRRVRPQPGDRLTIGVVASTGTNGGMPSGAGGVTSSGAGGVMRTLDIGELTGEWDMTANRISGRGEPGAKIEVVLWNPWYPGEVDAPTTVVGADGAWSVTPKVALHPASHFYVTEHFDGGDQLYYCQQIPMLYVEPGSPRVEVQTLWEIEAELTLERDGRAIAAGNAGGPWSGNVFVVFRDPAGELVSSQAGDRIVALLDGKRTVVDVQPLEVRVDERQGRVTGDAAPGATVGLAWAETPISGTLVTADRDGSFTVPSIEAANRPDRDVEVYLTTPDGHNMRRPFTQPTMIADLGTRTVTGRAAPGTRVNVTYGSGHGAPMASVSADVDAAGFYTATFAADAPVIAAGENVGVQAAEGRPMIYLNLEPITVELDLESETLSGIGPRDSVMDIAVYVGASEIPDRLSAFVEDDLSWSVDLRNPVSGLSIPDLDLIRRIEVVRHEERFDQRVVVER